MFGWIGFLFTMSATRCLATGRQRWGWRLEIVSGCVWATHAIINSDWALLAVSIFLGLNAIDGLSRLKDKA